MAQHIDEKISATLRECDALKATLQQLTVPAADATDADALDGIEQRLRSRLAALQAGHVEAEQKATDAQQVLKTLDDTEGQLFGDFHSLTSKMTSLSDESCALDQARKCISVQAFRHAGCFMLRTCMMWHF
jgi:hypothetical protein